MEAQNFLIKCKMWEGVSGRTQTPFLLSLSVAYLTCLHYWWGELQVPRNPKGLSCVLGPPLNDPAFLSIIPPSSILHPRLSWGPHGEYGNSSCPSLPFPAALSLDWSDPQEEEGCHRAARPERREQKRTQCGGSGDTGGFPKPSSGSQGRPPTPCLPCTPIQRLIGGDGSILTPSALWKATDCRSWA